MPLTLPENDNHFQIQGYDKKQVMKVENISFITHVTFIKVGGPYDVPQKVVGKIWVAQTKFS